MIVAGADGFMKSHYRKFNIKSVDLTPGDDYAMMREVLTRRFRRLADGGVIPSGSDTVENPSSNGVRPEGSDTSRIEPPRPPSERGADALAFGMLRADGDEPEDAVAEEFPDQPDVVLIDGGRGQLRGGRGSAARTRHCQRGADRSRQRSRPRCRPRAFPPPRT